MPEQIIDLIKITELPAGDAALQNPIMFGIGELVHTTPLSQIRQLLVGGIDANIETLLQGTKITEIRRAWIGGAGSNRQIASASINAGASFNIPANHLGVVRFDFGKPFPGSPIKSVYFAITTGAGTYGSGGTQLNSANVIEINTTFGNIETIFELGDIGNVAIESFVNASGPYIIQDVALFRATQDSIEKEWLFIGGSGTWGDGAQQTNAAMFIDLAEQDPIPEEQIPPVPITRATLSDLLQDMNAGNLIKDFIYRSEADGYFHFKGLSDPPFSGDLVPIATGGGGGGQVDSVTGLLPIEVDNSDPINPIVRLQELFQDLVNSALQPGDNVSELVNDAGYLTTIPEDAEFLDTLPLGLVKFDKHYTVGTPASPMSGGLTLDLTGAKVGRTVLMDYVGTSLPPFVTRWLQETDGNFVANELCYIGLHLHKLDGANSVITGVVNNI